MDFVMQQGISEEFHDYNNYACRSVRRRTAGPRCPDGGVGAFLVCDAVAAECPQSESHAGTSPPDASSL